MLLAWASIAIKYFSSSIRKQIPLTTVIENTDNYLLHIDVKDDIEKDTPNKEEVNVIKNEGIENDLWIANKDNKRIKIEGDEEGVGEGGVDGFSEGDKEGDNEGDIEGEIVGNTVGNREGDKEGEKKDGKWV